MTNILHIRSLCPNIQDMIQRFVQPTLERKIRTAPAVVLLGPRQIGKTTLAKFIAQKNSSLYLGV